MMLEKPKFTWEEAINHVRWAVDRKISYRVLIHIIETEFSHFPAEDYAILVGLAQKTKL